MRLLAMRSAVLGPVIGVGASLGAFYVLWELGYKGWALVAAMPVLFIGAAALVFGPLAAAGGAMMLIGKRLPYRWRWVRHPAALVIVVGGYYLVAQLHGI